MALLERWSACGLRGTPGPEPSGLHRTAAGRRGYGRPPHDARARPEDAGEIGDPIPKLRQVLAQSRLGERQEEGKRGRDDEPEREVTVA